ncbi:MAG: hypothetical protein WCQ21_25315, partial [Verrucomicrobiota bacterium]
QFLPAFLRFEQLTAYARYGEKNARSDIRGIRAVTRNISEANGSLRLSPKADFQILSDQKTYGLYGLFRMAAYSSGLLRSRDETRLTPLSYLNTTLGAKQEAARRWNRDNQPHWP